MYLRRLQIERYRGISRFVWEPRRGLNCLIGPGDAGKSTVLHAIALLLDPRPIGAASEYDYHMRDLEAGFHIEAVLADVEDALDAERRVLLQGWDDGQIRPLPEENEGIEPVLVVGVTGSAELEVEHRIETPDGEGASFSVALRRRLLLARLSSGERALTELRLGRGSLLDKAVKGEGMRPELARALAKAGDELEVPTGIRAEIAKFSERFKRSGLPSDLDLGVVSPAGQSFLNMLNLVAKSGEQWLPLAFAGQGTRQLALFNIAAAMMGETPVIVVDEPEAGLEPYRQRRQLAEMRALAGERGQIFMTTHSSAVMTALTSAEIWRLVPGAASPLSLDFAAASDVKRRHPESFLSRLPVLGEGPTEAGFLRPLLDARARADGAGNADALGLVFVGMGGQPSILDTVTDLLDHGINVAVFVDNETVHAGKRARLQADTRCAFGAWTDVRNIEEAVAKYLPFAQLPAIIELAATVNDTSVRALLMQLNEVAGVRGEFDLPGLEAQLGEGAARQALATAMGRHGWFKNEASGIRLGERLLELGLPPEIDAVISDFWGRVRRF